MPKLKEEPVVAKKIVKKIITLPNDEMKVVKIKPKDKPHYVNNKEMHGELLEYKKTGVISEKLGTMFMSIATRYTSTFNYSSYSYRDEMINASVCRMVKFIGSYKTDIEKPNPFAYFTKIAEREVIGYIKEEKRYMQIKEGFRQMLYDDLQIEEDIYLGDGK